MIYFREKIHFYYEIRCRNLLVLTFISLHFYIYKYKKNFNKSLFCTIKHFIVTSIEIKIRLKLKMNNGQFFMPGSYNFYNQLASRHLNQMNNMNQYSMQANRVQMPRVNNNIKQMPIPIKVLFSN